MKNHKKSLLPTLLCCIAIASFIISYSFAERCEAQTTQRVISELSLSIPNDIDEINYNDICKLLIKQKQKEVIMKNYISQIHLTNNKDKVFEVYYSNLIGICNLFNKLIWQDEDVENSISSFNSQLNKGNPAFFGNVYGDEINKTYIRIMPTMKIEPVYKRKLIDTLNITYPQVPFIKMVYAGEGYFESSINYKYINENYSSFLGKPLKDFILLKQKEEKFLDGNAYYLDATVSLSKKQLLDLIISWQKFRENYPNFKQEEVTKTLKIYTSDFMCGSDNSFGFTFDYLDNRLLPEAKKAYEEFLSSVNPKTKEYNTVKTCYNILKENKFKATNEFFICVENYENE